MDQGYKHFSHSHNLIMHHMPEGIEVSCSGCNSSATETVYVCWQCNFYLHEQCYRATRSLKHPSHPPHPLTLFPYPTYHSNSFYCNSCQIIGTGFSYSCADCDFDLHVQCAYSITRTTSFKNAHQFQELVPSRWNGVHNSIPGAQDHCIPPNCDSSVQYHSTSQDPSIALAQNLDSVPNNHSNQFSSVQGPSTPQNGPYVSIPAYPSTIQTGPSVSIATNYPPNPILVAQDPSMPHNRPSVSIPTSSHNSSVQYPFMGQTEPSVSIPTNYPPNPSPSAQDPSTPQKSGVSIPTSFHNSSVQYPSMGQTRPPVSIPTTTEYPSVAQSGPSVSIPTSYPPNPIPIASDSSMPHNTHSVSIPTSSHNSSVQYPSMGQTRPSVSIPATTEYPSVAQTGPSVSIPTSYPPNPIPIASDPSMPHNTHSVSIPTSFHTSSAQHPSMVQSGSSVSIPANYPPNPTPSAQDPSTPQKSRVSIPTSSHNSSDQYPSMPQTGPSVLFSTNPSDSITCSHDPSMPQNNVKDNKIMHFSHPHILSIVNIQEDEENEVICSGCEETLVGKGYSCVEPDCKFHLHESCFHLEKEIHHKSHPEHPLILLSLAPYGNENGEFTCNACFSDGTGFTYHCSICKFDLHIQCVSLPETVKRDDHEHMLKLLYSCPVKGEEYTFSCDVCHGDVQKDRWVYYCQSCDYGTHLGCVDCEECDKDSIMDPQAQLQMMKFQMEMARQQAQLIASFGSSLANLAG